MTLYLEFALTLGYHFASHKCLFSEYILNFIGIKFNVCDGELSLELLLKFCTNGYNCNKASLNLVPHVNDEINFAS